MSSKKEVKLLDKLGERYNMDGLKLYEVMSQTIFRNFDGSVASEAEMAHVLSVAQRYDLDPFCKEIYAGRDSFGGVVPIVGVDGWVKMVQNHPEYDGFTTEESEEQILMPGAFSDSSAWISTTFYRKDISHPTTVREYLREVYRQSFDFNQPGPWQTHTNRLHRHKSYIQAARMAFGFSGIYDPDEASRIQKTAQVSVKEMMGEKEGTVFDGDAVSTPQCEAQIDISDERKARVDGLVKAVIEKARKNGSWAAAKHWAREQPSLKREHDMLAYVVAEIEKAQEESNLIALQDDVPEFSDDKELSNGKDGSDKASDANKEVA